MTLELYSCLSDNNVVDKEISQLNSFEGSMKTSTDVVDPTFRITGVDSSVLTTANYIYAPDLGRYYFVKDVIAVRTNIYDFICHVDVLMTYKNIIKEQTCVIKRQENLWNLYLDDGIFKVYNNPNIITKAFPSGFTTQNFVLAVAGG